MKRIIVWQRVETLGLEYAEIESDPPSFAGDVVLVEGGERCAVVYRVECDREARTLRASIRLKREGARLECHLERNDEDRWTVNGTPAPQLDGLADVDLSVTPSTNTPPIHRLRLAIGQRAEVTAAWVRFPTLDVLPLRQIYRRVDVNTYEYQAPELQFAAQLICDDEGIVERYGDLWTASP
jgi:hypothetical protein